MLNVLRIAAVDIFARGYAIFLAGCDCVQERRARHRRERALSALVRDA